MTPRSGLHLGRCSPRPALHPRHGGRRVRRLPAEAAEARGHPAVRCPRDTAVPRRSRARPRQPAVLGRRRNRDPPRHPPPDRRSPGQGASPPPMRNRWPVSASATTRPSPRASPATGTGTGMTVTTPAAVSAAGCATTPARSGCSPANPQPSGRTTSPRCRIRSYLEAVAAALAGRPWLPVCAAA